MTENLRLRVARFSPRATLPTRLHDSDAGLDLYSCEDVIIAPGAACLVGTGIGIELPAGTEGQIRPRSGLALTHLVTVLNAPGTIDEGFRGELQVLLINHGLEPFGVEMGMRIAQLVVQPRLRIEVMEVSTLTRSSRGAGGFGSTGP